MTVIDIPHTDTGSIVPAGVADDDAPDAHGRGHRVALTRRRNLVYAMVVLVVVAVVAAVAVVAVNSSEGSSSATAADFRPGQRTTPYQLAPATPLLGDLSKSPGRPIWRFHPPAGSTAAVVGGDADVVAVAVEGTGSGQTGVIFLDANTGTPHGRQIIIPGAHNIERCVLSASGAAALCEAGRLTPNHIFAFLDVGKSVLVAAPRVPHAMVPDHLAAVGERFVRFLKNAGPRAATFVFDAAGQQIRKLPPGSKVHPEVGLYTYTSELTGAGGPGRRYAFVVARLDDDRELYRQTGPNPSIPASFGVFTGGFGVGPDHDSPTELHDLDGAVTAELPRNTDLLPPSPTLDAFTSTSDIPPLPLITYQQETLAAIDPSTATPLWSIDRPDSTGVVVTGSLAVMGSTIIDLTTGARLPAVPAGAETILGTDGTRLAFRIAERGSAGVPPRWSITAYGPNDDWTLPGLGAEPRVVGGKLYVGADRRL
ncbi:hypothetical protein QSJ18_16090 [Gordonia sp. ABSL1-1]|uniref:hypothetical protein n=1 Tax=Gordonia sp. ABSL1-1 TaxID=3053923 RepID=UPI0025729726|nr:hypothetical protein [Gordonia sp. ABSL1-1]MDL9938274.1 hypothetical protein [Gordonia sp. ABSL1-1]